MPMGATLREDGESHRQAWMRMLRYDPCAYCGRVPEIIEELFDGQLRYRVTGTVDHIIPKSITDPHRYAGGAHCWANYTGCCPNCNSTKSDKHMLLFLASRVGARLVAPTKEEDGARAVLDPGSDLVDRGDHASARPLEKAA
jgi:hypothetical protein